MGDKPGHPFRGNQYTIQGYSTSWGKRYRVLDPLGNKVRHLRNIDDEVSAQSIAKSVTERMLETGQELTAGHPYWDTKSKEREARVREALGVTVRAPKPREPMTPEQQDAARAANRASVERLREIYRGADVDRKAKAESESDVAAAVPDMVHLKRENAIPATPPRPNAAPRDDIEEAAMSRATALGYKPGTRGHAQATEATMRGELIERASAEMTREQLIDEALGKQVKKSAAAFKSAVTRASKPRRGGGAFAGPDPVGAAERRLIQDARLAARNALRRK